MALTSAELKTAATLDISQFNAALNKMTTGVKGFAKSFENLKKGLALGTIAYTFKSIYEGIDEITASARKLNISASGFQFLEFAAKRTQTDIGVLETGIKKLRTTLASTSKEAKTAFGQLGLDAKQLSKIPVDQAYFKIGEALSKINNSTDQVGIVNSIFGKKNGQEQLNALRENISELKKEFAELGITITETDFANFEKANKQVELLSFKIKMELRNAILGVAPLIANITEGLRAGVGYLDQLGHNTGGGDKNHTYFSDLFSQYNNQSFFQQQGANPSLRFRDRNAIAPLVAASSSSGNTSLNSSDSVFKTLESSLQSLSDSVMTTSKEFIKLDDLFGLENSGKSYLSSILTKTPQAQDETFTKLANDLKDIVQNGGDPQGVKFQSGLALMERIANDSGGSNLIDGTTSNSGMLAAVKELKDASNMMKNDNTVTVIVTVKDNEFISAVVDSKQFNEAAVKVAVDAADNSARQAVR